MQTTNKYLSNSTRTFNYEEKLKELLVIIPCYNEQESIKIAMDKLLKVANFNYVIIDDCSTDRTLEIIKENNWNYIHNETNLKLAKTFLKGIEYAIEHNYKYVVQYDGDGQHEPTTILEMLFYINKGYDIIITSRYLSSNKNHNKLKKVAHKILGILFYVSTRQKISDPTCGLRMYNWEAIRYFNESKKLKPEPSSLSFFLRKQKLKLKEIPTVIYDRESGKSIFNSSSTRIKYMISESFRIVFPPRK